MENINPASKTTSKTDKMTQEVVSAAQDVMEEGELMAPEPVDQSNTELTELEKDGRVRQGMIEWENRVAPLIETMGSQSYVKFKDLLWQAPSRGLFDVSRIKQSAYFFS